MQLTKRKRPPGVKRIITTYLPTLHAKFPFAGNIVSSPMTAVFGGEIIVRASSGKHPTAIARMRKEFFDSTEEYPIRAFVVYPRSEAGHVILDQQSFERLMILAISSDPSKYMRPIKRRLRKDTDE